MSSQCGCSGLHTSAVLTPAQMNYCDSVSQSRAELLQTKSTSDPSHVILFFSLHIWSHTKWSYKLLLSTTFIRGIHHYMAHRCGSPPGSQQSSNLVGVAKLSTTPGHSSAHAAPTQHHNYWMVFKLTKFSVTSFLWATRKTGERREAAERHVSRPLLWIITL